MIAVAVVAVAAVIGGEGSPIVLQDGVVGELGRVVDEPESLRVVVTGRVILVRRERGKPAHVADHGGLRRAGLVRDRPVAGRARRRVRLREEAGELRTFEVVEARPESS